MHSTPLVMPPMNWRTLDLDEEIPPWFSRGGMILFSGIDIPRLCAINDRGMFDAPVWLVSGRGVLPEEVKTYGDLATYVKTVGIELTGHDRAMSSSAPSDGGAMVCVWEMDLPNLLGTAPSPTFRAFREDVWHPAIPGNELPRGNVSGDTLHLRIRRVDTSHTIQSVRVVQWFAPDDGRARWLSRFDAGLLEVKVWEDFIEAEPVAHPVKDWEFRFISAL